MSKNIFQQRFTNRLLSKLEAESNKRKSIESLSGQFLILDNIEEFRKSLEYTLGKKISRSDSRIQNAYSEGLKKAKNLQARFKRAHPERFNSVMSRKRKIPELNKYTIGKDLFLVTSFRSSMDAIKLSILSSLSKSFNLSDSATTSLSNSIQKGHGESGHAVAHLDIATVLADSKDRNILKNNMDMFFSEVTLAQERKKEILQLFTDYKQIVTPTGDIRANYAAVITFQATGSNSQDAKEEKAMKNAFKKFISEVTPEMADWRGSSTLRQKVEKVLVSLVKPKKARVKSKTKGVKTKSKASNKVDKSSKSGGSKATVKKAGKGRGRVKKGVSSAPLRLLGVLNNRLPETVANNMGSPALNYRTGRFASSVEITDINTTAKGFPSIGYTYMLYPYQTFEPGYAQGSVQRDPRKLIDRSIREIAAEFAIGRFYTRRV